MIHNFIGAIIEAWEEVKINRARVILSLIGVGAAVWAMATVIALGTILNEAQQRVIAHWNGQPGTITVIANVRAENGASGVDPFAASVNPEQGSIHFEEFRQSVLQTVEKLGITIWTTKLEFSIPFLDAPDFDPCPPQYGGSCPAEHPSAIAVDPSYFSLHAHKLVEGRFMDTHDGQLQMNPVVVNESTWAAMGSPALATYPRLWLDANHNRSVTVVGVIKILTSSKVPCSTFQPKPYLMYSRTRRSHSFHHFSFCRQAEKKNKLRSLRNPSLILPR